jgi:hypothetical protein
MAEARKKELDFFRSSPHYRDLKNVGTGFMSSKLSAHLIGAIRKQLPVIQHSINDGIIGLEKELESLGGPAVTTRGAMVHLSLQVRRPPAACTTIPPLENSHASMRGHMLACMHPCAVCGSTASTKGMIVRSSCLLSAVPHKQLILAPPQKPNGCGTTRGFPMQGFLFNNNCSPNAASLRTRSCAGNSRRPSRRAWTAARAAASRSCWSSSGG